MAGQRILLVARHGVGVHALKEIIRLIVFADVIETEVKVLLLMPTALRRAVRAAIAAARPLAVNGFLAHLTLRARLVRLDANAVEEFG